MPQKTTQIYPIKVYKPFVFIKRKLKNPNIALCTCTHIRPLYKKLYLMIPYFGRCSCLLVLFAGSYWLALSFKAIIKKYY